MTIRKHELFIPDNSSQEEAFKNYRLSSAVPIPIAIANIARLNRELPWSNSGAGAMISLVLLLTRNPKLP